jgi:hypothetical protein
LIHSQPYRIYQILCLGFILCFCQLFSFAQSKQSLRYEIDAKRGNLTYTAREALTSGREFKRIDPSYYVGWMFEGCYKFEHAADYLGYKYAAEQLEKAIQLMDKDFRQQIRSRTSDVLTFIQQMKYHRDWDYTAYALMQCYSNMEEPDKVWSHLQRCKKADLQDELYLDTYCYLAWTVHRNRFYTSKKYYFLKDNIIENEKYANKLLDSMSLKIKRDAKLNSTIFTADYEAEKMPAVWHYKSILYSYQLNMESGAYYYEKLKNTRYFPANNYATFCAIQGKFREAEQYYDIAKEDDPGDKRMKESYYYLSIINKYKGDPKKGIQELKALIKANGSTPGYGWYNAALARDFIYDAQLNIAKRYAQRAEDFKEIHIGTTLGQSHYDFTISLIQLMIKMKEIDALKFENKNWWYSPNALGRIAQLTLEKYGMQFLIINQFAANPERDRVIYKVFSTESTVSFDEVWHLIDGFSVNFFLEKFEKEISAEKRFNVRRYFRYYVARLYMKKGEYESAKSQLQSIQQEMLIDAEYEKLLLARTKESLIQCELAMNDEYNSDQEMIELYLLYPQLIPHSGLSMPVYLQTNARSKEEKELIEKLKSYQLSLKNSGSGPVLKVNIVFGNKEKIPTITLSTSIGAQVLVSPFEFAYQNAQEAIRIMAYGMFNAGQDDKNLNTKTLQNKP